MPEYAISECYAREFWHWCRRTRVLVRDSGPSGIRVNAGTLCEPLELEQLLAARIKAVLAGVTD
jgi:hypothetical protein